MVASAQTDSTPGTNALEEIVVTAQHRTQRLQEVPISAQVIGGQTLVDQNLNSLVDVSQTVPSVHIGANGRSTELFIRGIGSGINQSFDQSVGVFIDDIYHGRSRTSVGTFLDLDRVEILKGPQSTFFGNNAIAGAFNIVTRKPGNAFDASANLLYGQFGQYAVEGAIGGPITGRFGARLAVTANGEDGWLHNINTGQHVPKEDNQAARLTLAFNPSDALDAVLKVEGGRNRNSGLRPTQVANCPPPAPFPVSAGCALALSLGVPNGLDNNNNAESAGESADLDTFESVLTANYHLGNHTVTSVTGYQHYSYSANIDADELPPDRTNAQLPERYNQLSQELRIASATDQPIEYLAGAYFQLDHLRFIQDFTYFTLTPAAAPIAARPRLIPYLPLGQRTDYAQDEHSSSVFGSASWNATSALKLTAGLRASRVKKEFVQYSLFGKAAARFGNLNAIPGDLNPLPTPSTDLQALASQLGLGIAGMQSNSRVDDAWLPSAKIEYKFNPQVLGYLSYAKGFKAGGFNGNDVSGNPSNLPFAPENVDAYEIGLKSEHFDRRVLLNIAAFRSDYTNLQTASAVVTAAGAIQNVVNNAGAARSQGVEVESQWAATERLHFAANVSYLDSRYRRYPGASLTILQTFCRGSYVLPYCAGLPNPMPPFQDLSGRPTQYAPDWSGNLTGTYRVPVLGNYVWTTELTGLFSSSYFITTVDDPFVQQGSYVRLDGRLAFGTRDGRWTVGLLGQNLTDQHILVFGNVLPGAPGSLLLQKQQPRSVAIQARFHW
jgi:outer membrane receptor protein involved in Fe transport